MFFDGKIFDLRVHGPNAFVLGVIHSVDIKAAGELFLIALSAAHIIWRWQREAKQKDKNQK